MLVTGGRQNVVSICNRIIEAGWLAVVFGVPLVFNPQGQHAYNLYKVTFLSVIVSVMTACCLVKVMGANEERSGVRERVKAFFRTPLVVPAVVLGLAYLVATATSISPSISFWGSLNRMMGTYTILLLIVLFVIMATHLRTRGQIKRLVLMTMLSSSVVCLFAVAEWLGWLDGLSVFRRYGDRVGSTVSGPIFLGSYLVLTIPLAAATLASAWASQNGGIRTALTRVGLSSVIALHVFALVLTSARGPWIGFTVAALVFGITIALWQGRKRLLAACVSLAVLSVLLPFLIAASPSLKSWASNVPYLQRVVEMTDVESGAVRGRLLIWGACTELLASRPTVGPEPDGLRALRPMFGYGPETLTYTFQTVYPPELRHIDGNRTVDRAHNIALELAATVGLIGLGAFILVVGRYVRHTVRALRGSPKSSQRFILTAVLAALCGYLVEQMFGIGYPADQVQFWANAGLVVGLLRINGSVYSMHPADGAFEGVTPSKKPPAKSLLRTAPRLLALAGVLAVIFAACSANTRLVHADMEARRGSDFVKGQDWGNAVWAFDAAIQLAPDRADYHWHLAGVYFVRAQEVQDPQIKGILFHHAARQLELASNLEPLNAEHYHRAAQTYALWESLLGADKYEQAVESYERASQFRPFDVELLNERALLDASHGHYEASVETLRSSLNIDPMWERTHDALGMVMQQWQSSAPH